MCATIFCHHDFHLNSIHVLPVIILVTDNKWFENLLTEVLQKHFCTGEDHMSTIMEDVASQDQARNKLFYIKIY